MRQLSWAPLGIFSFIAASPPSPADPAGAGACAACGACGAGTGGLMILLPIALIALNIGLLVWVARDAKARGLDSAVLWMALVMFTSVIGLIIYLMARPQGALVQ